MNIEAIGKGIMSNRNIWAGMPFASGSRPFLDAGLMEGNKTKSLNSEPKIDSVIRFAILLAFKHETAG